MLEQASRFASSFLESSVFVPESSSSRLVCNMALATSATRRRRAWPPTALLFCFKTRSYGNDYKTAAAPVFKSSSELSSSRGALVTQVRDSLPSCRSSEHQSRSRFRFSPARRMHHKSNKLDSQQHGYFGACRHVQILREKEREVHKVFATMHNFRIQNFKLETCNFRASHMHADLDRSRI